MLARNVLLASRVRGASVAVVGAARTMSSVSTGSFSMVSQNPAIMMMALNNAPSRSVVGMLLHAFDAFTCGCDDSSWMTLASPMGVDTYCLAVCDFLCRTIREQHVDLRDQRWFANDGAPRVEPDRWLGMPNGRPQRCASFLVPQSCRTENGVSCMLSCVSNDAIGGSCDVL